MKLKEIGFLFCFIICSFLLSSCAAETKYQVAFISDFETDLYEIEVNAGEKLTIPEVDREGYDLEGWYTSLDGGASLDERWSFTLNTVNSNLSLYANWVVKQFEITIDTNGGSLIQPVNFDFGESVYINEPQREGYTFVGWSPELPEKMPANNINVSALWEINNYVISFNSNGGSQVNNFDLDYSEDIVAPINPTREGYTFVGWSPELPQKMPATNIEVAAVWEINSYSVSFDTNGGLWMLPLDFEYQTKVVIPEPERYGYTFIGWNQELPENMPAMDIMLTAVWQINQYNLIFDSQGGTEISQQLLDYNSVIQKPEDPAKPGYNFIGWNQEGFPSEQLFDFSKLLYTNMTLIAKWELIDYTVSYELFDGENSIENIDVYQTAYWYPLNEPSKYGYTFEGWYDNEDFEGSVITSIQIGTVGDLIFYAKWTINVHNLVYLVAKDEFDDGSPVWLNSGETIIQSSMGDFHSAALTSDGRLFMWGSNSHYESINNQNPQLSPYEVSWNFNLSEGEKISYISLGGMHSGAVTSLGRLFMWGTDNSGQLGTIPQVKTIGSLQEGELISKLYLAGSNTFILTSLGRLYMMGSYSTTYPSNITSSFDLDIDERVVDVASSDSHFLVLTSNGRIFSWGNNSSGQLGNGTRIDQGIPTEITSQFFIGATDNIVQISVGSQHSAAITSTGRIFLWGNNSNYQLAVSGNVYLTRPTEITDLFSLGEDEVIISTALGYYISAALTNRGSLYIWGSNKSTPKLISNSLDMIYDEKISSIAFGMYHFSFITDYGRMFSWGDNGYGQVGNGTTNEITVPYALVREKFEVKHYLQYEYNQSIELYIPELVGYTFIGWYTDRYLQDKFNGTNMPDNHLELWGLFKKN